MNLTTPAHRAGLYTKFKAKATTIFEDHILIAIHPRAQHGACWRSFIKGQDISQPIEIDSEKNKSLKKKGES